MTFGFGNLALPFTSLPDGTISFLSLVFPTHLQACAHNPSRTAPRLPLLHVVYGQDFSFIISNDNIPSPRHTHTSMSPPWLELMLKQCGLFMKVERRREQHMGWKAPSILLCFCTPESDEGPCHDNSLTAPSVKVKGGHLTLASVQVL